MKLLQSTLKEAFNECGGADDGLDLNEFRIVLDVLQSSVVRVRSVRARPAHFSVVFLFFSG